MPRRGSDVLDWQRNREVQRLTREIFALQSDVSAKVVAAAFLSVMPSASP